MTPYDEAAEVYVASGLWPIPIREKTTPVVGTTGYEGTVTLDKVNAWLDPKRRGRAGRAPGYDNIAIRHDLTVAIDVDRYGQKDGDVELAKFAAERGLPPLPATWSSTARGQKSPSRQYVYRIPEASRFKTKPCTAVELCCSHHRYTVCAPSVHPEGGTYAWYLPGEPGVPPTWGELTDRYPRADEFAELPAEWFAILRSTTDELDPDAEVLGLAELLATFKPGPPDGLVAHLLRHWGNPNQHVGHDEFKTAMINVLMLGREEHPGVPGLVELLRRRFVAYLKQDRPQVAEFEARSLLDSCVEVAQKKPLQLDRVHSEPSVVPRAVEGSVPFVEPVVTNLPEEFWSARASLDHIRRAAHSRNRSADVVLLAVLARLASLQHHRTKVDTGLSAASLNMIVCAVGPSGAGKTSGIRIARELLPAPFAIAGANGYRDGVPLGSGEGIPELFMGYEQRATGEKNKDGSDKTARTRCQVRYNAYAHVDEGEQLFRLAERAGSTLMTTLRSAWVGETLGQANASEESTRIIDHGTYSLGLVIGLQPSKAGTLFDDAAGGTPQRFLFASTHDPSIPEEPVTWPGDLLIATTWGARTINVAPSIARRLRVEDRQRNTGELVVDDLDAHEPLHLAKLSALLATLDGRDEVTEEDWALARQVWNVSCSVRSQVRRQVDWAAREEQQRVDRRVAEQRLRVVAAETEAVENRVDSILDSAAKSVGRKVWKVGACAKRDLGHAIAGKYKRTYGPGLVGDAIALAIERGYIGEKSGGYDRGEIGPGDA